MSAWMSRRTFLKGTVAGAALAAGAPKAFAEEGKPVVPLAKRVVILGLDGIRPDGLAAARTPNIDRLFRRGVFSNTTLVEQSTGTWTQPSWTTLFSGGGQVQHGVTGNSWTNASTTEHAEGYRDAEGYVPSVFSVLKDNGVNTAFYWNWSQLIKSYNPNAFTDTNDVAEAKYEENFNRTADFLIKHRDERSLVFLYDVHTDNTGHRKGWMSDAYLAAIGESDAAFGRLLSRLAGAGLLADTHFLFLSDHGGHDTTHGKRQPTDEIVPWGIVGPGIRRNVLLPKDATLNNTVNNSPILLRLFGVEQPNHWVGKVPDGIFA